MHSYFKQIERLLNFTKQVQTELEYYHKRGGCHKALLNNVCYYCEATKLLNDEPVRYAEIPLSESPEDYKEEGWNPSMRLYV